MKKSALLAALAICVAAAGALQADDKKDAKAPVISLAGGKISLAAPVAWEKKKPRSRIVQYEFAAPVAKGDKIAGRITVMGAGGSVDANVQRWMGQFTQPDGKSTKDRTKVTKKTIVGGQLHVVDITGTFLDKTGGPFAPGPTVKRDNYRMLGAIIVTPKLGQYFVKMYGPKATIDAQAKAFQKMVEEAKIRD